MKKFTFLGKSGDDFHDSLSSERTCERISNYKGFQQILGSMSDEHVGILVLVIALSVPSSGVESSTDSVAPRVAQPSLEFREEIAKVREVIAEANRLAARYLHRTDMLIYDPDSRTLQIDEDFYDFINIATSMINELI